VPVNHHIALLIEELVVLQFLQLLFLKLKFDSLSQLFDILRFAHLFQLINVDLIAPIR
jgi:hypothetical protein